jgi:hypothetical protein
VLRHVTWGGRSLRKSCAFNQHLDLQARDQTALFLSDNDDLVALPDQLCPAPIDFVPPPLRDSRYALLPSCISIPPGDISHQTHFFPRHAPLLYLIPSIALSIFYHILSKAQRLPLTFEDLNFTFGICANKQPYSTSPSWHNHSSRPRLV